MQQGISGKLDWSRMLGFEQVSGDRFGKIASKAGGKPNNIAAKAGLKPTTLGSKAGLKPAISAKVGVKIGSKPGLKPVD